MSTFLTRGLWTSLVVGAAVATWFLRGAADVAPPPVARITVPSAVPAVASSPSAAPSRLPLTPEARPFVEAARACVGDVYDAAYYAGGPPPRGRGACTDVLYWSYKGAGVDLQELVNADIRRAPLGYPNLRDDNIDYRWAPNLIVWFGRHVTSLPVDRDWRAGDVVLWSLSDDGVADHCGIVSDATNPQGRPLVIHNFPPACREDDALDSWPVMGHFRGRPH